MLFFSFFTGVESVSAKEEENIIDDDDDTNDRVIYIVG